MKKLIIALTLALVMVLVPSSTAFAQGPWDVEDPCVAANEDFIVGWGPDDGVYDIKSGAQQPWYPGRPDNEGYNLYRDDATDTGNLDTAAILTFTPDEIDLPMMGEYPGEPIPSLTFWKRGAASPDTWYWALSPRGYNLPAPEAYNRYIGLGGVFWVEVFNFGGFDTYKWDDWSSADRVIRDPLIARGEVTGVNAVQCLLYIPEGTHLSYPDRPGTLVTNLTIEWEGSGVRFEPGNMDFSQVCTLKLVYPDGTEEVVNFAQIRDGQAS